MRDKITEAAIHQILKFGLRKFTIDDITAELGISKKTVYKYFDSKYQIIEDALDNYLAAELNKQNRVMASNSGFRQRFEDLTSPANHEQIPTRLLAELQQFFPELWDRCEEVIRITRTQIIQMYADGIKNGEIRSDVHPAIIDLVVKRAIDGVLDHRFLARNELGLTQALEDVKGMVLYGILEEDKDSGGRE